jgi:hypothetical protein
MNSTDQTNPNDNLKMLAREIKKTYYFAGALVVLILGVYAWNFFGRAPAPDPEQWGQFGDYIGGILNPITALLAFYWLTRSVLLQKEEMQRTAEALIDSARHQAAMAAQAERAARINASSALLASVQADVDFYRAKLTKIDSDLTAHNRTIGPDGNFVSKNSSGHVNYVEQLNVHLDYAEGKRKSIEEHLRTVLDDAQAGTPRDVDF